MNRTRLIIIVLLLALTGSAWMVSHHSGLFPWWIVSGRVVDANGHPVENAKVEAFLGLGAESDPGITDADGRFSAPVGVLAWTDCKGGPPGISVTKPGYQPSVTYYERWSWGPKFMRVKILLHKEG